MASVAVCPHCYLQLAIPDDLADDARVACPTCHKEFDLVQTVLREIPEAVIVERVSETAAGAAADEAKTQAKTGLDEMAATPARAATLAEIMAGHETVDDEAALGPSFELPNVPLVRDNGGTVEFDSIAGVTPTSNTEFELDDVDFESVPTPAEPIDERAAIEEPAFDSDRYEPEFETASVAATPAFETTEFSDATIVVAPPPRRRKRSALRMLAGTALGGVLGLGAGYYLLMFLLGPTGDFLQIAKYLPQQVLPASFGRPATRIASAEAPFTAPPVELQQPIDAEKEGATGAPNIPASYVDSPPVPVVETEPEEPASDSEDYEPPQFDDVPATPLATETTPPAPVPLPIHGPSYTANDLETALDAGTQARGGLVGGDLGDPAVRRTKGLTNDLETALDAGTQARGGLVGGDLGDPAVRRTKGLSYARLCDLANTLSFTELSSAEPHDLELQSQAEQLFAEVLASPQTRDEVARIAAIWIESPHRRHGGVFLAGTASGGQIAGDVYEYQVRTPDGKEYAVLSSLPIDATADTLDASVAIVGTIVDHPADEVTGYTGTAPRAIWAAHAIPLE